MMILEVPIAPRVTYFAPADCGQARKATMSSAPLTSALAGINLAATIVLVILVLRDSHEFQAIREECLRGAYASLLKERKEAAGMAA